MASIGDTTLRLSGDVGLPPALTGTKLRLDLRGKDLSEALPAKFSNEILAHTFRLAAVFLVEEGNLRIDNLDVGIANTALEGF